MKIRTEVIALNHHVEFPRNFYSQWYPNARFPSTVIELSVISHLTHHRGPSAAWGHHTGFLCAHIRGSGGWEGFHRTHWPVVSRPDLSFWAWPELVHVLKTTEPLWKYHFAYFSFPPHFLFSSTQFTICVGKCVLFEYETPFTGLSCFKWRTVKVGGRRFSALILRSTIIGWLICWLLNLNKIFKICDCIF